MAIFATFSHEAISQMILTLQFHDWRETLLKFMLLSDENKYCRFSFDWIDVSYSQLPYIVLI